MNILVILSVCVFTATFLGGSFALRFKDKLHLILGFSAGAVIGVAYFDLLPEALNLGGQTYGLATITSLVALGFIVFMVLDRFVILHSHAHDEEDEHAHNNKRGILGAGSLSIHSFLDGAAIGLAFQISAAVGAIVAVAVLVHDFSDGINTVNLILKNGGTKKEAFRWLIVDLYFIFHCIRKHPWYNPRNLRRFLYVHWCERLTTRKPPLTPNNVDKCCNSTWYSSALRGYKTCRSINTILLQSISDPYHS
jgi:hypothetical protein